MTSAAFRVPRPLASTDGRWVADGWIATEHVDGLQPFIDQPERTVDVGCELAELLVDRVSDAALVIRQRTDRWAIADRVAWGELAGASLGMRPDVCDLVERLSGDLAPLDEPSTVIHGDLANNIFLDSSGTPVVLDLSPYVRPVRFGSAIVVVDHMLWFGGSTNLGRIVDADALARALTFRLVAHHLGLAPGDDDVPDEGVAEVTSIADALGL